MVSSADRCASDALYDHGLAGTCPHIYLFVLRGVGAGAADKRQSLLRVDPDILLLGTYYVLVIACYLIFEMIPINYRPVLIEGRLISGVHWATDIIGSIL